MLNQSQVRSFRGAVGSAQAHVEEPWLGGSSEYLERFFIYWKLGEVIFGLLVDWPLKIDRPYEIQTFSYLVVATESEFSILLPRSPGSLPMLEASESGPQVRKTPTPHEILWEPPVLRRRWILIGLISKKFLFMLDSLLFQRTVLIDGLYCFLRDFEGN